LIVDNKIDEAISMIEEDLKNDPDLQIAEAFRWSPLFQQLLNDSSGLVQENGKTYNLRKTEDLLAYVNWEIETKEKNYEVEGTREEIGYSRRQIKYLFSHLIESKFEQQMKPEYEKMF